MALVKEGERDREERKKKEKEEKKERKTRENKMKLQMFPSVSHD